MIGYRLTIGRKRRKSMAEQSLWKISDVAEYLGVPRQSIYKMTGPKSALRIPHMRIAGKVRFRKADIDRWLDQFMVSTSDVFADFNARKKQGICHNGLHS
jgi:excisionase family DNA binding protein